MKRRATRVRHILGLRHVHIHLYIYRYIYNFQRCIIRANLDTIYVYTYKNHAYVYVYTQHVILHIIIILWIHHASANYV